MTLKDPRIVYGVHSFSPYDRATGLPFGTIRVLGGSTFTLNGELVSLNGGSAKFPWAIEDSTITSELAIKPKEYPDFLFELFLGKTPTENGSSTGDVDGFANKSGVSTLDATTGIATVTPKASSEADMKFTRYVVKVVSPTTVDVYALSNIDFANGTDAAFEDDSLKITATPLTITTAGAVEVPGFGIELTGGSGTIAMVADDTAIFEVRSPSSESMNVRVGGTADVFPEFGAVVVAQKRGNGEMLELDIFRLKAVGLPIGLEEKAFSEAEITAQAFYDSQKNGVFDTRYIKPSA